MAKLNLSNQDLDTIAEALTACIDEGDFNEGELLNRFRELLPRIEMAIQS